MRARLILTSRRVFTWCCVILLAVLSLLPGEALAALWLLPTMKMVRTVLPAPLEHFVAYAGLAAVAMAGYGPSRGGVRIIGALCAYAASWSTSVTFCRAGIRRSGSSLARRLERSAAGSLLSFSGVAFSVSPVEGLSVPCNLATIRPMGDHGTVLSSLFDLGEGPFYPLPLPLPIGGRLRGAASGFRLRSHASVKR